MSARRRGEPKQQQAAPPAPRVEVAFSHLPPVVSGKLAVEPARLLGGGLLPAPARGGANGTGASSSWALEDVPAAPQGLLQNFNASYEQEGDVPRYDRATLRPLHSASGAGKQLRAALLEAAGAAPPASLLPSARCYNCGSYGHGMGQCFRERDADAEAVSLRQREEVRAAQAEGRRYWTILLGVGPGRDDGSQDVEAAADPVAAPAAAAFADGPADDFIPLYPEQQGNRLEQAMTDNEGALQWASQRGDEDVLTALLDAGVPVDQKGKFWKRTALMQAASFGQVKALRFLHSRGADVNAVGGEWTALYCGSFGNADVVRLLLELGADPNKGTRKPLHNALQAGKWEVAKLLIQAGADVNDAGTDGSYMLGHALASRDQALVRMMVRRGADLAPLKDLLGKGADADGDAARGEGTLCVVCMERERSVLFHPCMHVALCTACDGARGRAGTRGRGGALVAKCPVCRGDIKKRTRRVKLC
ncbi:hypothetical protein ABPG75_004254 [Micractinium tetrahymenae]